MTVALDSRGHRLTPHFFDALDRWTYHRGPGAWADSAACAGHNPEIWFPQLSKAGRHGVWQRNQLEQAKAICQGCPVREQCLTHAVDNQEAGVWGGMTETERDELRRRRKRGQP